MDERGKVDTSGFYTSGAFAKRAHISLRTVRYYDQQNILKPTYVTPEGRRYYSDQDFVRLQQILLFKYLGFSLEEIKELTIAGQDDRVLVNSLELQRKLVQDQIEHLQTVEKALFDMSKELQDGKEVDWSDMLGLIYLTGMENRLQTQYQNEANISARIRLHSLFSQNPQGWFPWVYEQCDIKPGMQILEVGCGNGRLWTENQQELPDGLHIVLSDISDGMLRDVKRDAGLDENIFTFQHFDCQEIPFPDESFDLVIANHTLFYCSDISKACAELSRVLKSKGRIVCGTYGPDHMKEVTDLVQAFDERITLSSDSLYDRFGRENGGEQLQKYFHSVEWKAYSDSLEVNMPEPLIEYILSCHGNQNQYILDRYQKFRNFVTNQIGKNFHITKDAGAFIGKNKKSRKI